MNATKSFKSDFYLESFSDPVLRRRIIFSIAVFVGTFLLSAIISGIANRDGIRRYSKIDRLYYGFSQMSGTGYLITFLIAVIMVPVAIVCINLLNGEIKIIVGLVFDETNRKVKIRVREVFSSDCDDITIPYSELSLWEEKRHDGYTVAEYDCITFMHRGERIGTFYKNHDMWSDSGLI
jgi:hypothetical protein